jgi:hypothetical protein
VFLGYGNLTPKTDIGKLTTIFYALAGIPLMFIYMSTIGSILATSFKYTYTKLCRLVRCFYGIVVVVKSIKQLPITFQRSFEFLPIALNTHIQNYAG